MSHPEQQASLATCGCASPPKRVCDLCEAPPPFVACSLGCLQKHLEEVHHTSDDSATRAAGYVTRLNRRLEGDRERYTDHRRHLAGLLSSLGGAPDIGILGAGNCSDLDPEQLAHDFQRIHLIDLDPEALERGRESFPSSVRDRVTVHGGVDMSGLIEKLDTWGEGLPDDAEMGRAALVAIRSILQRIGLTFHFVLSDCILSQLPISYRRAWVTSRTNWERIFATLTAVHLATIVGSVRSGGRALIACDALGSRTAPGLRDLAGADSETLQAFVRKHLEAGDIKLDPDPAQLMLRLQAPGISGLVESPQITAPWLWNTGDTLLVFGLLFRRR